MKYIFSWPEGREIRSVTELQNGRYYVCASVKRLARVNYGNSREQFWKGGRFKHNEGHLFTSKNGTVSVFAIIVIVVVIISKLKYDEGLRHQKTGVVSINVNVVVIIVKEKSGMTTASRQASSSSSLLSLLS